MLVSDLIDEAFLDLGVIQAKEKITDAMQADAFLRLNQLLSSLSAEGAIVYNQVLQAFQLQTGVTAYTLGVGGTFFVPVRAQRVTSWRASYAGLLMRGGRVLSLDDFATVAAQDGGEQAAVPKAVGADTAYPLINVRVFPPPSSTPGQLELGFWTPLASFTSVNDVVNLPPGFEDMLHFNLAVHLYPQYPRQGGIPPELAANAQNSKASIVQQNAMGQQPPAQQ